MQAFFDAHCHLADLRLEGQLDQVLSRAAAHQIVYFIQGGVEPSDWKRQLDLQKIYKSKILPCFGLHPWWVANHDPITCNAAFKELRSMIGQSHGIGELGLDFSPRFNKSCFLHQEVFFRMQIELALDVKKPLVLHIVRAHEKALSILDEYDFGSNAGFVHAFSGSWEIAQKYLEKGLLLSVGGVLGRAGYKKLKRAVSQISLEQLLLESDTPDQTPDSRKGMLNEPFTLQEIAQVVADLQGTSARNVLQQSSDNAISLFSLPKSYHFVPIKEKEGLQET